VDTGEVVGLALTGVFGLVSSIGVVYQVHDIRGRTRSPRVHTVSAGLQPVVTVVRPQSPELPTPTASQPDFQDSPSGVSTVGPPAIPPAIRRARIAIVVITVLLVLCSILSAYLWYVEGYIVTTGGSAGAVVTGAFLFTGFELPVISVLTICSRSIGRGRNTGRIGAIAVLLPQMLLCCGLGVGLTPSEISNGTSVPIGWVSFGVLSFAVVASAIVTSFLLLLPQSNSFFRDTTRWRRAVSHDVLHVG
jgi:hypothetical protein